MVRVISEWLVNYHLLEMAVPMVMVQHAWASTPAGDQQVSS